MVSRFGLKRDKTDSPTKEAAGAPHTARLGSGADMEAGRRATYCSVRPEEGPGAELERSLTLTH